jgi:hypothetical protein
MSLKKSKLEFYKVMIRSFNTLYYLSRSNHPKYWYLSSHEHHAETFFFAEDAVGSYREFAKDRYNGTDKMMNMILSKEYE